MDGASKLTLILAMSIGGCAGSTAGGIKIIRLLILFRLLYLVIQRAAAPSRAIIEPRLNGKKLEVDEMLNAVCIFVLFITVIAISWLPFLAMDHKSARQSR
jgi:trk system potassium uptake protein